ncbi:MAG: hypothetical protein ABJA64_00865, partial [Candidatus Saccharibacteria bacterium]
FAVWCGKGHEPGYEPKKMGEVAKNFVQMIVFLTICILVGILVPSVRLLIGLLVVAAMAYFTFKHDELEAARQKKSNG